MEIAIKQVIIVFILIITGLYGRRKNIINDATNKGLCSILLNITLPMYIITAFNIEFSISLLKNLMIIFFFGFLIHIIAFYLSKLIFNKHHHSKKNVLVFCTTFCNCGFMAFPILEGLWGKLGVFYGSIFLAPFNIFLWTIGIRLYDDNYKKIEIKKILNPGIVSIVIGILIFIFSIPLPYIIRKPFEMVGAMTTPLSMMITGALLADFQFKKLFSDNPLYLLSLVRLLIIPVITFVLFYLCKIDRVLLGISVCITSMPCAAMASVFAEQFDREKELSTAAVFLTTFWSLITIPLIILFINVY